MGLKYMVDGVYSFSKIDYEAYKEDLIELMLDFDNECLYGLQFAHTPKQNFTSISNLGISFVYFRNNAIVGYINSHENLGCCNTYKYIYIGQMYVKKEVRNLGIGKKMIGYAIDCFQTENYDFVRIDTHERFGATLEGQFGFEYLGKVFLMMIKHKMIYSQSYALDLIKSENLI